MSKRTGRPSLALTLAPSTFFFFGGGGGGEGAEILIMMQSRHVRETTRTPMIQIFGDSPPSSAWTHLHTMKSYLIKKMGGREGGRGGRRGREGGR